MRIAAARTSVAFLLAVVGLSAEAATATVATVVVTRFEPNTTGGGACTGTNINIQCESLLDQPLLPGDPDGLTSNSHLQRDYFAPSNTGATPNYILTGSASARAQPGSLHASAQTQAIGMGGGGASLGGGISAGGFAHIEDQIRVRSSAFADGTAVSLSTLLDISGTGRGTVSLIVRGRRNGIFNFGVFGGDENSNSNSVSLADLGGSFTAFVGETLNVEYSLRASTGSSTAGWAAIDVLNGRAAESSYGNSAFLYFSATDPAADVFIEGLSGYDYRLPPVPEPSTAIFMLLGLGLLGVAAAPHRHGRTLLTPRPVP